MEALHRGETMGSANYEIVGKNYSEFRQPDPRISSLISSYLESAKSIVNIGAGTGSYEPTGKIVSAVEPSEMMIAQREEKPNTVVYQASAESLPFNSNSHDAALAILTIHHWENWKKGLSEAYRVARDKIVLLTWLGMPQKFWLYDYIPELSSVDKDLFPSLEDITSILGQVQVINVPIPHDCTDGFLCAYWARPEMYLNSRVRSAISSFSRIADVSLGLNKLSSDIQNGEWRRKYGHLLAHKEFDFGYRLIVGKKNA